MFLVGFVVLLFGGLVFIAGNQFWVKRDDYTIHFTESIAGLELGAPLKVNGVGVGRVESIGLHHDDIETVVVEVSVEGRVPLRRDASAVVQLAGITGLKFIEVNPGSRDERLLEPGSRIRAGASEFNVWTGRAEDIARQVHQLLARLLAVMDSENMAHIDGIIEELHRVMARVAVLVRTVNDTLSENRVGLKRTIKNVGSAAEKLTTAGDELTSLAKVAKEDVHKVLVAGHGAVVQVDQFATEGTKTMGSLGGIVEDARSALTRERLGRTMDSLVSALDGMTRATGSLEKMVNRSQGDLDATLEAIRSASEHLEEFSRTIRDNPGALLRRGGLPEVEVPR
jgi:phospholipid/cholesterol/gamma-HCH transport system substrate-binding protein